MFHSLQRFDTHSSQNAAFSLLLKLCDFVSYYGFTEYGDTDDKWIWSSDFKVIINLT